MNYHLTLVFFFALGFPVLTLAQDKPVFKVIPLGVKGGIDESDLSSYLLAAEGSEDYICLDAGTLHAGLERAVEARILQGPVDYLLKNRIKAYLISHAHLDHLAGLIINSPEDTTKNIYGLPFCLDILKEKYFTWKNWANFADEGDKPTLNKYHYHVLNEGREEAIEHSFFFVTPFVLSHSNPYQSTAFLIRKEEDYFLYLGDTGADEMEKSERLLHLWEAVAPLIRSKKLKAIFIEVSFPDEQPVKLLFGHLTPSLFFHEMQVLDSLSGNDNLRSIPIAITHIKPNGDNPVKIRRELAAQNKNKWKLVFPKQAVKMEF